MRYFILGIFLLLGSTIFSQKYTATETLVFPSVFREDHKVIKELTYLTITPKEVTIISGDDTLLLKILEPFSRREGGDCLLKTFSALSGEDKFVVGFSYQRNNLLNLGILDSYIGFLIFIVNLKTEIL